MKKKVDDDSPRNSAQYERVVELLGQGKTDTETSFVIFFTFFLAPPVFQEKKKVFMPDSPCFFGRAKNG